MPTARSSISASDGLLKRREPPPAAAPPSANQQKDRRLRTPEPMPPNDARLSRRELLAAAGAGAGVLLLSGLAEKAAAARRASEVSRCGSCWKSAVVEWNEAFLQGVRESKLGPPMVARALAICHTCIYDAWAAYDDAAVGTRLGGSLRRPAAER